MTTEDIIKSLPMDETLKQQILNLYPFMESAQKHDVDRLAWNTYHTFYQQLLDENLQVQFDDAMHDKDQFGEDFYARALKKTDQQMNKDLSEALAQYDLTAARKAMEQIVTEIRAAKAAPKKTTR
jgi:uncharacterized membrane protein YheB (UPF0754 family)